MNTYENFKKVITVGKKPQKELLNICDIFLMNKRISDENHKELVSLINKTTI